MSKTKPTTTGVRERLEKIISSAFFNEIHTTLTTKEVIYDTVQKIVALIEEEVMDARFEHWGHGKNIKQTVVSPKGTSLSLDNLEQSTDKPVDNLRTNEIDYCIRPGTRPNCTCKTCQPLEEKCPNTDKIDKRFQEAVKKWVEKHEPPEQPEDMTAFSLDAGIPFEEWLKKYDKKVREEAYQEGSQEKLDKVTRFAYIKALNDIFDKLEEWGLDYGTYTINKKVLLKLKKILSK